MRVRSRAGVRLLTSGHALPLAPGVAQPPPHQTQCRLLYLLAPSAYPTPNDASNVKPPRDANGHIHSIARSRLGNYSSPSLRSRGPGLGLTVSPAVPYSRAVETPP